MKDIAIKNKEINLSGKGGYRHKVVCYAICEIEGFDSDKSIEFLLRNNKNVDVAGYKDGCDNKLYAWEVQEKEDHCDVNAIKDFFSSEIEELMFVVYDLDTQKTIRQIIESNEQLTEVKKKISYMTYSQIFRTLKEKRNLEVKQNEGC